MATVSLPGGFPRKGLDPWAHVCESEAGQDLGEALAACSEGTKAPGHRKMQLLEGREGRTGSVGKGES